MKSARQIRKERIDTKLSALFEELGEECQNVLTLLSRLKKEELTAEEVIDLLAEVSACIVHLHAHTEGLDDLIGEELEKMEDPQA